MARTDPVLGILSEEAGVLTARVLFEGRPVPVRIDADGGSVEGTIAFARHVAGLLAENDCRARAAAVGELLDT